MTNKELIEVYTSTGVKKPFSLSENAIKTYLCNINYLLNFLDDKNITDITSKDIRRYLLSLEVSDSTYNLRVNSLKSLYKVLKWNPETEDLIIEDPTYNMPTMKCNQKVKTPLTKEEQMILIRSCKNIRDKAIIVTLLSTGLRIHELVNLTYEQYLNRNNGRIKLLVNKGSHNDDSIIIDNNTEKVIEEYLKVRKDSEWLFVSNGGKQMDRTCVSRMMKVTARRSGEFTEDRISQISNHLMRHSMATNLVNEDVPIDVVAKLLRHSNLNTVMTYAKTSDERVKMTVR